MKPKNTPNAPLDELRMRLESWCWRAFLRFSLLVGESGAVALVESLLSEYMGRRLDELTPQAGRNDLWPRYEEIREFFERFAPEVAAYLPREVPPDSLDRLLQIQRAMCSRIADDSPTTLGRCGRTLLSREWKEMEAALPVLEEARARLASAPEGFAVENECRAELEAILGKAAGNASRDPKALLDLRRASRRSLTKRLRQSGTNA